MKEETGQPFILDFDGNHHAVLEPDFEEDLKTYRSTFIPNYFTPLFLKKKLILF